MPHRDSLATNAVARIANLNRRANGAVRSLARAAETSGNLARVHPAINSLLPESVL